MPLRIARSAALMLTIALSLALGCGRSSPDYSARPAFLVGEPARTDYDGTTNGLLTGKAASLAALLTWAPPASPTAADLRTLAIQYSYLKLLDVSAAGGFGTYYGSISAAGNKGSEYIAVTDDGSGLINVTTAVAVPSSFDRAKACILAVPSSGSRGVYGEIGTIGEWALNKGCAVALTDKGTGTGAHDLDRDLGYANDGTQVAAGSRKDLTFNVSLLGEDLTSFKAANPNRLAYKHAHGKQNPERNWGRRTLEAIKVALYVLNKQFPGSNLAPGNTLVIASSISNGGGASLAAAEQDTEGLIDGVAVAEPQLNMPDSAGVTVTRGGAAVSASGKPLYDYTTYANLFQPCATQSAALKVTNWFTAATPATNRCAALAALGLVSGTTTTAQGDDALAKLHAYGWEPDSDMIHDSHYGFEFTSLVATTYASAYSRASVSESLCGYSAGGSSGTAAPAAPNAAPMKLHWATGGGLWFENSAVDVINDRSVGGPTFDVLSVSASTNKADYNIDGATCLRRLMTGAAVGSTSLSAAEAAVAARVKAGMGEVRLTGNLRGKPAVIVHGRNDALIPVNHTSRPYAALNKRADAGSQLRYYEVNDANHFDALVPYYPRVLVPLHVYTLRALDAVYANLTAGTPLPPSQVVRSAARSSATAMLTSANVPPLASAPAPGDQIAVTAGAIDVPN